MTLKKSHKCIFMTFFLKLKKSHNITVINKFEFVKKVINNYYFYDSSKKVVIKNECFQLIYDYFLINTVINNV